MHSIQKTSNRPHRHLTTAQAPLLPEADEKSSPLSCHWPCPARWPLGFLFRPGVDLCSLKKTDFAGLKWFLDN